MRPWPPSPTCPPPSGNLLSGWDRHGQRAVPAVHSLSVLPQEGRGWSWGWSSQGGWEGVLSPLPAPQAAGPGALLLTMGVVRCAAEFFTEAGRAVLAPRTTSPPPQQSSDAGCQVGADGACPLSPRVASRSFSSPLASLALGDREVLALGAGVEGPGLAGARLRPRVPVISGLAAAWLQMAPPPAWRPAQMLCSCTSLSPLAPESLEPEPGAQGHASRAGAGGGQAEAAGC